MRQNLSWTARGMRSSVGLSFEIKRNKDFFIKFLENSPLDRVFNGVNNGWVIDDWQLVEKQLAAFQ